MAARLLALLDIDGTLLLDDRYVHGRAMVGALREVYGAPVPDDAVMQIGPWGKTDLRIARESLALVSDADFDARRAEWVAAAGAAFMAADHSGWTVRPGLGEAFNRLRAGGVRLAPLTGNLRAIAAIKLGVMGLADLVELGAGAYGDDAEERTRLGPIARERAGGWPPERTWIVGDTEADLTTARADGLRCVVFASPREPAGADAVVATAGELADLLTSS